jgi:hypothetical protein
MKKSILIFSTIIILFVFALPYFLNDKILSEVNFSITFLSGLSSFITVVIAVLLYSKYGIDKSIKERNLEATLNLLEAVKKTTVTITGNNWMIRYKPTTFSMKYYEKSYSRKLIFSGDYWEHISNLSAFSENLYLPKDIKQKLDRLLPFSMGQSSESLIITDYGKVELGKPKSEVWKFDIYNNEPVTLYDYFLFWEGLISTIQEWCKNNSDSQIDLNIN